MRARGRRLLRARGDRRDRDRGSVSVWVVLFAGVVLALLVLVVDGGQAMVVKTRAADIAEQAARAAADDVNVADLRAGHPEIDEGACLATGPAATLIGDYASGASVSATMTAPAGTQPCVISPDGQEVTVWVQVTANLILSAPGAPSMTQSARESAVLTCGTATANTGC
jgi:Flp pilus assembly protein TadG